MILGLVLNAVVLWNTRHRNTSIARLRAEGHSLKDEDVARHSGLEVITVGGQAACESEARRRPGGLTVM
ncbi:Tn3 family transposase [Streptomyces anulatus]